GRRIFERNRSRISSWEDRYASRNTGDFGVSDARKNNEDYRAPYGKSSAGSRSPSKKNRECCPQKICRRRSGSLGIYSQRLRLDYKRDTAGKSNSNNSALSYRPVRLDRQGSEILDSAKFLNA